MRIQSARAGLRRAVTATAVIGLTVGLVGLTPAQAADSGLFGSADATYDGVYRQSTALLGLDAAHAALPAAAVGWLTRQQCASGAFQAYRADTSAPCAAPDPAAFTGPDSNSTALAALALKASGRSAAAARAVGALRSAQNTDGGWGYTLGGASDVNSTALALAALHAFPTTLQANGPIPRATAFLKSAQIACTAPIASRGALPYQPGQPANALASTQGLLGWSGTLPVSAPKRVTVLRGRVCAKPAVVRLAWHVNRMLVSSKGRIPSAMDAKQTDWNATATGVIALASARTGAAGMAVGIRALGANVAAYTGTDAAVSPAATGTLIQAAVATGRSPRSFGTLNTNLVRLLMGTLQR
jgi:hypothetical protein